jgi:hypothetical protein
MGLPMDSAPRVRGFAPPLALGAASLLTTLSAIGATADQTYEESLQGVIADAANPERSFDFVEAAIAAGDLRGAAAALERILLIDPRLANIRLELGVLYMRMGNDALAQYHINEALRAPNVPQTVRARAERLLAQASSQARRNTFRFETSLGFRNDSNANAGPTGNEVFVMDPFTFQPILVPIGEGGETSDSSSDLTLRLAHSFAFSGGSSWDTSLSGYAVRYADLEGLDQYSFAIDTGPTWVFAGSPDAPISLRPSIAAGKAFLDGEDYYDYTGAGLGLSGFWTPVTLTQLRVNYEDRDFQNGARFLSDRSGKYLTTDLRQYWQLGKWQLSLGLTAQQVDAQQDYQSSDGFGGSAGVRYFGVLGGAQRPWSVYLNTDYMKSDYDAADPFVNFDLIREDERLVFSAGAEFTITRSFALALDLSQLDNDSSLPNYEYDNFSVGVRALFRF